MSDVGSDSASLCKFTLKILLLTISSALLSRSTPIKALTVGLKYYISRSLASSLDYEAIMTES